MSLRVYLPIQGAQLTGALVALKSNVSMRNTMARTCTICKSKNLNSIDQALIEGISYRDIASRYSVGKASLQRHASNHLPAHLLRAKKTEELTQANNLVSQLISLEADAKRITEKAEQENDFKCALAGVRERSRLLQIRGTILGQIKSAPPAQGSHTTVNRITNVDIKALLLDPESRKAMELLALKAEG